jgi:hypothetical protein
MVSGSSAGRVIAAAMLALPLVGCVSSEYDECLQNTTAQVRNVGLFRGSEAVAFAERVCNGDVRTHSNFFAKFHRRGERVFSGKPVRIDSKVPVGVGKSD